MRLLRTGVVVAALAIVVAACGDSAPTPAPIAASTDPASSPAAAATAAPSTAPTPAPTPTPVPVTTLAAAVIDDPAFTAEAAVTGSSTLGKAKSSIKGKLEIEGRATHQVRTTTTGKKKATVETITANSTRYQKQKGVWVELGESANTELIAQLRATTSFTDLGVEERDGAQLHHLQATLPGVPSELALGGDATNATATVDVWVTAEGVPVAATVAATWTQEVDGKPVEGSKTIDLAFSNFGGEITVAPPEMIWAFQTSKRNGYRMACPVEWVWDPGDAKTADSCFSSLEAVFPLRARQTRATLSFITPRIPGQLKNLGYRNAKITSNKKWKLDGVPARKIEFTATAGGDKVWGQAVYAIKGAWWYLVVYEDFEKRTAEDRALFKQFVGSFDFR